MTATKWRVRKDRWPDGDEYGGWFVFPPGKDWGELWHSDIALFDGHPEALAYADRMARTVEVTLPRVGDEHSIVNRGFLTLIFLDGYGSVWLQSEGATFHVLPEEIEETALALLALARRKEQK